MKEIKLEELRFGSYYTEPLYLDRNFILLTPEIPISELKIRQLKQSGYSRVFTNGEESSLPGYAKGDQKSTDSGKSGQTAVQNSSNNSN